MHILYLYVVLAASPGSIYHSWVPSGEFGTMDKCEAAIKILQVNTEKARCIKK